MTTLKEFEEALREQEMNSALEVLAKLRERDRANRVIAPARRITGQKMTPELARRILELHESTKMTQQEIAFKVGVNQGRVNEVIKRGKWLSGDPTAPEAVARDEALERASRGGDKKPRSIPKPKGAKPESGKRADRKPGAGPAEAKTKRPQKAPAKAPAEEKQLVLGDL